VWEEIIVSAPRDAQLVALSATVANVKEIADWISIVHRPIVPIFHPHRPVPLHYFVADLAGDLHDIAEVRRGRARVVGDEPHGPNDRTRWYTRRVVDPVTLIEALEQKRWLPAIYFIFSRAGCERAMEDVLTEGKPLITREQRQEVDESIAGALADQPALGESNLSQSVFRGLRLGVALHHAGILPGLKRLIETLFERGLCKVVFATETMSLGIHMPARAVVLQGLTKRTDRGFRSLTHNELTQMAGRAGRRGIDPEGQCVIALDARDGLDDLMKVVDGSPEPIESRFKLGYGSAAALIATGAEPETIRKRIESSFGQYQNLKRIREMEHEVQALDTALAEARRYEAPCGDFARIGRYRRARQEVDARRHAAGRGGRRGERSAVEAEPGRLALVRRKGAPSLAVILRVHAIRGHRVLFDALLPHGAVVRLKSGLLKRIFWATPPLNVPRDLVRTTGREGRHEGRGLRVLAEQLAALGRGGADRARAHARPGGHAVVDRVPPLSVGSDLHVRSDLARAGAAGGARAPEARGPGGRARRVLAGVPGRGGGARAVRRAARARAAAQGPADRRAAPRQRAAGGRGRLAAALRRCHPGGGRRALLGADGGVALGRADDRSAAS
jgi:hypothetical protein